MTPTLTHTGRGRGRRFLSFACSVLALTTSFAAAQSTTLGPVWDECEDGGSDAGGLGNSAQRPEGTGELECISGKLGEDCGLGGAPDLEDMYVIRICDPALFSATTEPDNCAFADFNTQLFLFRRVGVQPIQIRGLLANDDLPSGESFRSLILPLADDGTNALIEEPGVYLIAITGFNRDPFSPGGPIFLQLENNEISGPDGQGGSLLHTGWASDEPPAVGAYRIALTGATFIEGVQTIDCNENGVHDACDIANGTSQDINNDGIPDECLPPCLADIADNDGEVNVNDLLLLLSNWGTNGPGSNLAAPFNIVDVSDLLALLAQWGPCD